MHITSGNITQKSQRRCFHAPQSAATDPATCSEGNAAPRTRRASVRQTIRVRVKYSAARTGFFLGSPPIAVWKSGSLR